MESPITNLQAGASIPLRQWCIPLFQIPSVSEKFSHSVENFPNFTFSRKIFRFSSTKISDDLFSFLVNNHKFRIPLFSLFQYIFPLFRQNYFPHTFTNFPPCFRQIYVFFTYFMCLSFPPAYFYHDAFLLHTMHVGLLDPLLTGIVIHYKDVSLRWANKFFFAKIDPELLSSWFLTKLWTKTWYLFMDCVT